MTQAELNAIQDANGTKSGTKSRAESDAQAKANGATSSSSIMDKPLYSGLMELTDWFGLTNKGQTDAAYGRVIDTYRGLSDENTELYDNLISGIGQNQSYISQLLGGEDAVTNYVEGIQGLKDYEYGKTVDQFMDPAAQYNIDQSVKATQNAMAGQGGLSGGAAAAQLQAIASQAASSEYDKAFSRMSDDKAAEYGKMKDVLSAEGDLSKSYLSNLTDSNDDIINAYIAQFNNKAELQQGAAQAAVDKADQGSYFGNLFGGIVKGIFG